MRTYALMFQWPTEKYSWSLLLVQDLIQHCPVNLATDHKTKQVIDNYLVYQKYLHYIHWTDVNPYSTLLTYENEELFKNLAIYI